MPASSLLGVVIVAAVFLGIPFRAATAQSMCQRFAAPDGFPRTASVVQSDDGEVVVAAYLDGVIKRYDVSGRSLGSVERPGGGRLDFLRPGNLRALDGGWVLQDSVGHWVWTTSKFIPKRGLLFQQRSGVSDLVPPLAQLAILDFIPRGEEMYVFAFLRKDDERWAQRYFARLKVGDERVELGELLDKVDGDAPMSRLYSGSLPLLAATDTGVFGLRYGEIHSVVRLDGALGPLKSFPAEYASTDALPECPGSPMGDVQCFSILKRMRIPRALFGRGAYLYVLARQPNPAGGARWDLFQLDPGKDEVVRRLRLPSSAPQVRLAPGPDRWVLLEQGDLEATGFPLTGWVTMPSSWIEDPSSEALTGDQAPDCVAAERTALRAASSSDAH